MCFTVSPLCGRSFCRLVGWLVAVTDGERARGAWRVVILILMQRGWQIAKRHSGGAAAAAAGDDEEDELYSVSEADA